ncbi:hypothetical protein PMAYCL1PPCAC_01384, partial [Pristionchus mayeri]
MVDICEDKELKCKEEAKEYNGFVTATFYHRFEHDPTGKRKLWKGQAWWTLNCTVGFKEPNGGTVWNGLSCTGGLKGDRCSEEQCG